MHRIDEPLSTRFLEVALIINNVDMNSTLITNGEEKPIMNQYHLFIKNTDNKVDSTKNIASFIRNICYSTGTDIGPIVCVLDNDSNVNLWLNNLEMHVIPYLISNNILVKNKG